MNDLEQARKMLEDECDDAWRLETGDIGDIDWASIIHDGARVYAPGPNYTSAARRAIEMYRLVKYGPELVEAARCAFSDGAYICRDSEQKLANALSHFPQEDEQ